MRLTLVPNSDISTRFLSIVFLAVLLLLVSLVMSFASVHQDKMRQDRFARLCVTNGGTWIEKTGDCIRSQQ